MPEAVPAKNGHSIIESTVFKIPDGLSDYIEVRRKTLEFAMSLLTSVDATLSQAEGDYGDFLRENDAVEALVIKARRLARPVKVLRLAIHHVYLAYSELDSYLVQQAASEPEPK